MPTCPKSPEPAPETSVQYWLDMVGFLATDGMRVRPIKEGEFAIDHLRLMAELLIPYHAPDGKKYGFTVYILNKPNVVPAFEEAHALLAMAPEIVCAYGHLCREVLV